MGAEGADPAGRAIELYWEGRFDEAAALLEACLRARADDANAHFALGLCRQGQQRLDDAERCYRRCLELDRARTSAWNNLGNVRLARGDLEGAAECLAEALRLDPAHRSAKPVRASLDLPAGLREVPRWRGEPFAGRTLLLYANQGMGDTVQQLRLLPALRARGGRLVLACQRPLLPLVRASGVADAVCARGEAPPACDLVVPGSGLRHALGDAARDGTTAATRAAPVRYLRCDPARRALWRRLLRHGPGLHAGLVWAGNPEHPRDAERSLRFTDLAPLLAVPGVRFVSLQVGAPAREAHGNGLDGRLLALAGDLRDFADTAAAIDALDLVVAVDTAVAHVTGALGRPLWLLLHRFPDTRWLRPPGRAAIYPDVTVFRQHEPGVWKDAVAAAAAALARRCAASGDARASRAPAAIRIEQDGVRIRRCRFGPMAYRADDARVGAWLDAYGEHADSEAHLLRHFLKPGQRAVDVGAGAGAHTVLLARVAGPDGEVLALEPRARDFHLLCANLALNALGNVRPRNVAAGGGDDAGGAAGGRRPGDAPVVPLDALDFARGGCHLLRVHAPGGEAAVLAGAGETIARCRPAIYASVGGAGAAAALVAWLGARDYRLYRHRAPRFNPANYFGVPGDEQAAAVTTNLLALPAERAQDIDGLPEVRSPGDLTAPG